MKKLTPSLISTTDLVQEDQYILTKKELELLNKGELTFYAGGLYWTKDVPREIPTLELTVDESLPLLNLYGDEKLLQDLPDPLGNKHLSDKGDFVAQSFHPSFNQPTQAQIERCKQFPNSEPGKIRMKGPGRPLVIPEGEITLSFAIDALNKYIRDNPDKHPYRWVLFAEPYPDVISSEKSELTRKALLDILNRHISLKEGMELEGFSAKEFEQKYKYVRPSLLEAWTAGDAQLIDNIRKENAKLVPSPVDTSYVVENPSYLTFGIPITPEEITEEIAMVESINEAIIELEKLLFDYSVKHKREAISFTFCTDYLSIDFIERINKLSPNESAWDVALSMQDQYWNVMRGYTISILRLVLKIRQKSQYVELLQPPIEGMK